MRAGERGQVTAFVVVFAAALFLMAGLVLDGGRGLSAQLRATNDAQAAARAGAEQIDLSAYRADGTVTLDPTAATTEAEQYLAAAGDSGDVAVSGDVVLVTVHVTEPTNLLGIVGLHSLSLTGRGEAQAERGITEAGQ